MFKTLRRLFKNTSFNYKQYWENRYQSGGNSGDGSYGVLASYKSEFINSFVIEKNINTVIDFGVGDGNQLIFANYAKYLGLDISKKAISICEEKFISDQSKSFILYDPEHFRNHGYLQADLVICLDVLYHITSENEFHKTLSDIYSCSNRFIILYSSMIEMPSLNHIVHRNIIPILETSEEFRIVKIVSHPYPELTSAQFVILEKNT